jgi:hypothetical protein
MGVMGGMGVMGLIIRDLYSEIRLALKVYKGED